MSEHWQKAKQIFAAGLEIDPAKRGAFLDEACGGDLDLRRDVESLLAADASANSFLNNPAISEVADVIAPSERFEKGKVFGQYEIVELIGSGGMGEVYLARDTRLNRQVALKFLSTAFSGDASRFRRFEREALAVSALNHPNILTIYELKSEGDTPFIATEYVKGQTLANRLKQGGLDLREILHIAEQTAFALATAHEAGIIHRDIKPENIMLRDDGIVKVLDFGLAKLISTDVSDDGGANHAGGTSLTLVNTNASGVLGTVAYMSPEQASGRTDIDSRTDIWSLGIVIYEMLTGTTPFTGETAPDVISGIIKNDPERLGALVEGIPAELERIVETALQKHRTDRHKTTGGLLDDIRRLKSDLDFQSKLENHPITHRKSPRSRGVRESLDTSPIKATHVLPGLGQTKEPLRHVTSESAVEPSPRASILGNYRRPILITLLTTASLVLGGFFLRSPLATQTHTEVFTVDTTVDDPTLTACTPAPNDCSIGGAIANSFADDQSNTVEFDKTFFDSHKTINLKEGFAIPKPGKLTVIGPPVGVTLLVEGTFSATNSQNPVTRLFALFEPDMELEIRNLTLTGGTSFQGGAIHVEKGTLTVINSIITGNSSTEAGGGIANRLGKVTLIDSTVNNNRSLAGGGIANINGTMTLINTIVSNNNAPLGGGIRNEKGTLTMIHTTLAENSASSGGGLFNFNGTTNLYNSIIANSKSGGDCLLYSDTINAEHSLIEDGLTCVNGTNKNNLTGDPGLGSRADNWTLLPRSIAIDAGSAALAVDAADVALSTDRRGARFPRIVGGAVDLGAFEYQSPTRKEQCKNEGWRNYSNPRFSSQDQCIVHVVRPDPLQ